MIYVYYPKWNPSEGDAAYHYLQSSAPVCTSVLNASPLLGCYYDFDTQSLLVNYPVATTAASGTTLTFDVDSFLNPYSGIPRNGFVITTRDLVGGEVDSSQVAGIDISFKVTEWTSFDLISMSRVDTMTTVAELSTVKFHFELALPVDPGCRIQVTFPSDMPLTTGLTQLTSEGALTATLAAPTYFDEASNTFWIDGCDQYSSHIKDTLYLYKVKNKGHVKDTQSFSVYFWAIDQANGDTAYPIAKAESGLVFYQSQFTPGTIIELKVIPWDTSEVQNHTRYRIDVWPVHYIPQSSKITIKFPIAINLTEGSCLVQIQVSPMSSVSQCSVSGNMLTLTYPFGPQKAYSPNSAGLMFVFSSGGENPLSEKDSGSFQVDTYAIDGGLPYHIDTNVFYNVFTPTRGTVAMRISDISTYITYAYPNTYTFMITPTKKYPQDSIFIIEIPPVITIETPSVPSCTYIINGGSQTSTAIETFEVSQRPYLQVDEQGQSLGTIYSPRIKIKISDAFYDKWYLDPGTPFQIKCDGFRNPRTTRETATFQIHAYDKEMYYIEERTTGITTQMAVRPDMPQFQADMSNFTNGDVNTYTMTLYSPLPHFTGDILYFQFPDESILPTTVQCVAIEALTNIECSKTGPRAVKGILTFQNDFNEVYVSMQFQILDIQNPPDTRLSSPFSNVYITDPLEYQLTQYIYITTLQTLYFATVQIKKLTQTNYGLLLPSNYTFTYTCINRMPSGSSFLITYPPTVQPPVTLTTCEIAYKGISYSLYACAVDLDNSLISISGGFNAAVDEFTELAITFGPVITPISQLQPGKFTLQSYVGTTYRYLIDEIPEGLIPLFECDHPCRTCELPSRTRCTLCKTNVPTEVLVYLELNQCLSRCPDGKFGNIKNDKICELCPDQCLTCFNELTCTRCKGNSPLTELYNGWCFPSCPPGLCPINFKCSACNAPPFSQIQVTANPSTVGLVSQVRLNAALSQSSGKFFETGDIMWLLIPAPGTFIISDDQTQQYRATRYKDYFSDISLCQSQTLGITVEYCTIYLSRVMLKISTTVSNLRIASFLVGNFQNPSTTTPIAGIQTFLTNGTDTLKSVLQNTYLSNLSPEKIAFALLQTGSKVIGASNIIFTVSFKIKNLFIVGNQIWVTFPYWNPRSNNPKHMIATPNPTCVGITNLKNGLNCYYDTLLRMLKITQASDTEIPIETLVSFTVDNFQNPYNGIEKSGFQIQTMEETGTGIVDQSEILSITVDQFANLEYPALSRADLMTTVGELSSLTFSFKLNLPVDPDCRIRIIFPADQPLTTDLTQSRGSNMFSSASGLSSLDLFNNFAEVAGCPTYSERTTAYKENTVTISKILNIGWVKDTQPFALEMYAVYQSVNYPIAKVTQADFIVKAATMLTVGSIYSLSVAAFDTARAGMFSRYRISMQPIHGVPSKHKIKVRFPTVGNIIILNGGACSITSGTGIIEPATASCSVDTLNNEVTLIDGFGPTGQYVKNGPPFSFLFSSGGVNPTKTCGTIQFEVSTFATIDGTDYPIDYKYFDSATDAEPRYIPFLPEAPSLAVTLDAISSKVASYKPVTYTFTISPELDLPIGSLLIVKMPPTVRLPFGVSQVFCTATLGVDIYYEYATPYSLDPLQFRLANLFKTKPYSQLGTPFKLVCDGIWNPRTLSPTPSIIIQTGDQERCAIQSVSSGLSITMEQLPSFKQVHITNDNIFNGQYSTFTIEIVPTVIFVNFDIIYITFPPELTLPSIPSCQHGNLLKNLICLSPSPNVLKAELTFNTPQLADDYRVEFKVFNVRNPSNTKQTIPFYNILAQDIKGNDISLYQSVGPTIRNQLPSIAEGSLTQADNTLGAKTTYTITYTTMNYMPKDSSFLLDYPHTVVIPPELNVCTVTFLAVDYPMKCLVNSEEGTIKIYQGLAAVSIPEGSQLSLRFSPVTNPSTPHNVAGFKITSFTDWYQLYLIDKVPHNLVPQYQCAYPCATCPSQADRSTCLSCFTTEVERYLSGTKCVAICPTGTKPDIEYKCAGPTIDFDTKLLSVSNYQASYEPAKYSIQILPLQAIPDGSIIEVTFPTGLGIAYGGGYIVCETYAQRTITQAFNNTGKITLLSAGPPIEIQIEGLFQSKAIFDLGTKITITCDRLKNPPTLDDAGSFSVTISNPLAAPQTVANNMQVKMSILATKISFKMEPLNRVTGQLGDFRFTISSGQALHTGSRIKFDFPKELSLPQAIICSLESSYLNSIACSQEEICVYKQALGAAQYRAIPSGRVTVVFQFVVSPHPANTPITFIISQIGNPQNTMPIQVVDVALYNADGTLIPEPSSNIPSFSMKVAAEVKIKSLTLDDYTKGATTGVTITYNTMNQMKPLTVIVLGYPLTANFQQGVDIYCAVQVDGVPFAHQCRLDRLRREIVFTLISYMNVPTSRSTVPAGAQVTLVVKDFVNEAMYGSLSADIITIKSYSDKSRQSAIDKITSGLNFFSCEEGFYMGATECTPCVPPCLQCMAPGTVCTACDQTIFSEGTYLYKDSCYVKMNKCPGN